MARKPHFYLIPSSLGMKDRRQDEQHLAAGVVDGPQLIASNLQLEKWGPVTTILVNNWNENQEPRYKLIAANYQMAVDSILATLADDEMPVVIGGDHSSALPAIVAAAANYRQLMDAPDLSNFGLLMLDSHTDLHQPSTTPSQNFHGMWLRPLVDKFEHEAIEKMASDKIPASNVMFVGDHSNEFEATELEFIAQQNLQLIEKKDYLANQEKCTAKINAFIARWAHLHVTFDLDFVTSDQVGCNCINHQALTMTEFESLIGKLVQPKSLSLDISEFNPHRGQIENSLAAIELFLRHFLEE